MDEETEIDAAAVSGRDRVQVVSHDIPDEHAENNQQIEVQIPDPGQRQNISCLVERIPDPPSDWKLNRLLDDIALQVSNDQLERLKFLFRGHGKNSIGKGVLEKCTSCHHFFQILKEREYISRDNLLYLQSFLYMIENRELIEKTIEYSRSEGNLYFFEVDDEPEPGFRRVRFHLVGEDLNNYDPNQLRGVRDKVADILCVPREKIRIVGVQPGSSLCITLYIPEMYVLIFQDMLEEKKQFTQLFNLGIDLIYIDDRVYSLSGFEEMEIIETEQQKKIMHIYDQYREQAKQLEKSESLVLDLKRKLEEVEKQLQTFRNQEFQMQSKLTELDIAVNTYKTIHGDSGYSLEDEDNFKRALSAANIPESKKETIKHLLEVNTRMVESYAKQSSESQFRKLNVELEMQKGKVLELKRQLDIHRYLSYRSVSEVNLLQTVRMCLKDIPLEHFEKYVDIMKTLSNDLTKEEKTDMLSSFELDTHAEIKKHMQHSEDLFLIGIICMEYSNNRSNLEIEIENFITEILKRVNRSDLSKMFEEKVNEVKHAQHSGAMQHFGHSTTFEHTFFERLGPMLYPRLLRSTFSQSAHGHGTLSTVNSFAMFFRPFHSFFLRTIETFHFF